MRPRTISSGIEFERVMEVTGTHYSIRIQGTHYPISERVTHLPLMGPGVALPSFPFARRVGRRRLPQAAGRVQAVL